MIEKKDLIGKYNVSFKVEYNNQDDKDLIGLTIKVSQNMIDVLKEVIVNDLIAVDCFKDLTPFSRFKAKRWFYNSITNDSKNILLSYDLLTKGYITIYSDDTQRIQYHITSIKSVMREIINQINIINGLNHNYVLNVESNGAE